MAHWHSLALDAIYDELKTDAKSGLNTEEVKKRGEKYGSNKLPEGKKVHWWQLFWRQFKNPLVFILVVAAVMTFWLGEFIDTIVISLAVLVNVLIGFFQEFRSNKIFEKLAAIVTVRALVRRGGRVVEVDSKVLVPGDIILLRAGTKVPADARLIEVKDLETNEALLTGESASVTKKAEEISEDSALGDRINMVYTGTVIERGEGVAVVVATGAKTEIGTIAGLTATVDEIATPIQERLSHLGRMLTLVIFISAVIIFGFGILESRDTVEMFTLAVAVAVAGIPEGLPASVSVVLAVGMQRILKRKGLVKKLVAAEGLGSTTVICTDKTGTLTEGAMKLEKLLVASNESKALLGLALANEALVQEKDGKTVVSGESTDRAKMQAFLDKGNDYDKTLKHYPRITLMPFTSERGYIAAVHKDTESGKTFLFVTGVPELLLKKSSIYEGQKLGKAQKEVIRDLNDENAKEGYRMIGVAWRELHQKPEDLKDAGEKEISILLEDLTFGGLAAIRDPIREDVREAMRVTREAGVTVVMVTGDHHFTARAIGKELGFSTGEGAVLMGSDLDAMSDDDLKIAVLKAEIYSRVSPKHKMRIVSAWQANKQSVAMTGDGVNDAPALKAADTGVALGSGTDVTKEAADLVLLDDSFATITEAIKEGRVAFDNIRKVSVRLLANAFTSVILIMSTIIFKIALLPVTAVQILWINLAEDSLPTFALAFEPAESDVMKRKPLRRSTKILNSEAWAITLIAGIVSDFILLGAFLYLHFYSSWEPQYIQTFIFSGLGGDTVFIMYSLRSLKQPIWKVPPFSNKILHGTVIFAGAMVLAGVYLEPLNRLLGTVPLRPAHLFIIAGMGILQIIFVEAIKFIYHHFRIGSAEEGGVANIQAIA